MPRTKRVGIVVQPTRIYCRRVVNGVLEFGAQKEWEHILLPSDPAAMLDAVANGSIDGIIGNLSEPRIVSEVFRSAIPAVDISPDLPDTILPRVMTDEVAVGRLAAEYMLSLGLPQFAFVGSAIDYSSRARSKGFEEVLKTSGRPWHAFLDQTPTDWTVIDEPPPNELQEWVKALPKPIGVFSTTDGHGLQFLSICRKFNIAVPKTAAVLAVGNDDLLCDIANPPLSSIALSTQRIGFDAAKLLADLMEGKIPSQKTTFIPPAGIIPRHSSELTPILDRDVAAAVSYISLHAQEHLHVEDLLREILISRSSLDERFLKTLGYTPATAIRMAQVELAKKMLANTNEPMSRVAKASGFLNAKQLAVTFHNAVGVTPTAYRAQIKEGFPEI